MAALAPDIQMGWTRRLRAYWALIKSLQTGLLLITGDCGILECALSGDHVGNRACADRKSVSRD